MKTKDCAVIKKAADKTHDVINQIRSALSEKERKEFDKTEAKVMEMLIFGNN